MQMIREHRVSQTVHRKNRREKLHPIANPLPPMFKRFSGDHILSAKKSPAYTPLHWAGKKPGN
jgi:hypothetical protein